MKNLINFVAESIFDISDDEITNKHIEMGHICKLGSFNADELNKYHITEKDITDFIYDVINAIPDDDYENIKSQIDDLYWDAYPYWHPEKHAWRISVYKNKQAWDRDVDSVGIYYSNNEKQFKCKEGESASKNEDIFNAINNAINVINDKIKNGTINDNIKKFYC